MTDHLIQETRYYKDGRIRIKYWCGKNEIVPAEEELEITKGLSRRRKADCGKCCKASGWS